MLLLSRGSESHLCVGPFWGCRGVPWSRLGAVSENRYLTQIAKRTVLSEDALSILVPIMENILGWDAVRIRSFFEKQGYILQEWEKVQTDTQSIVQTAEAQ
jgi:hypothetical protein